MRVSFFDPKERARQKAASRAADDEDLRAGHITLKELNIRNGGYGLMKGLKLVLSGKRKPATGNDTE